MRQKILLILGCVFLCACQSTPDASRYALAVNSNSGLQPVKYVPVPMPGQLMSTKKVATERLTGEAAINAANKKSLKQPTSGEYINSIMTFDYMPGALYQIYAAPLSVTDIQFQTGERIITVGAGDTSRWQVSKTHSGVNATRQEHLLIKPIDEGLSNSLVVTTDIRTYHLMLRSTPKTYMASVTWHYPSEDGLITKLDDDTAGGISDVIGGVDISRLNFGYTIKVKRGSKPDWYPTMVFNDGAKTYIKFQSNVQDVPSLFVGEGKNSRIVNYRVNGNYYIIDNLFHHAQLRGGQGHQTIVQISMKVR